MKKFANALVLGLFVFKLHAQNPFNCLSHQVFEELMKSDPIFRNNQEQLEKETQTYLKNKQVSKSTSAASTYVVPVVFHVIYSTQTGNISEAQILDQVDILNKEFKRQQADTILTPTAFLPLSAPFDVEFRLATIDPFGNCTNGINRVYSTLSNCSFYNDGVKALSYWPSNKYLNIWVVQTMHYDGSLNCNGGGYARFPGGAASVDGVNIRGDLIGSIGTAATNSGWGNFKGRYLIHELGHWFNLRHIWGDANCGNDLVADTPPHVFSNSGCPNFPHNPNSNCLGSNANGEMFTNYMDYTNGNCLNMFSAGQVARMTAAITSPVSGRNNLWSANNLLSTGTADPYIYPSACVAVPAILPSETAVICIGDSVKLTDYSYGGLSTSRQWNVPGGNAQNLTDSIIYVKYAAAGLYDVALTKNYLSSSKTTTFTERVLVLNGNANLNYGFPFSDDFENSFLFDTDWSVLDKDNDGSSWELTNSTSYSGNNCVGIANFNKPAPISEELISPSYDLIALNSPTLTFRLHYAGRVTGNYDKLQVFISNNCGKTWNSIYQKTATSGLKTVATNITNSYTPAIASSEWRLEQANIMNLWAGGVVNFKFVFTSGGGNNIFIDDINIGGVNTTGINEEFILKKMELFPNPTQDLLTLKYNLTKPANLEVEVTDLSGRVCLIRKPEKVYPGENTSSFDFSSLSNGVYFITLKHENGTTQSAKFIKQSFE